MAAQTSGSPARKKPGPMPDAAAVSDAKKAVIEHYGQVGTLLEACKRAGQTYSVVRAWRDADPAFALALQQADDLYLQVIEDKARQIALEDGDPKTVMFLLKCIGRDKYGETRRIEHSGPGGAPIMIHAPEQIVAQIVAVAHQFPTVAPRLRESLQRALDALPKQ